MVCLSPARFTMAEVFVENSMARLLSLYESKSKPVSSTAKAALMQMFQHIIGDLVSDSLKKSDSNSDEEVKVAGDTINNPGQDLSLKISNKLLKGIVSHLNSTKETLWPVPINNSTTYLAMDLLALIISEGKKKLSTLPDLMAVLDEVFDPFLNEITSLKSDYGISIRLINCMTLFAVYIECGLGPLTRW